MMAILVKRDSGILNNYITVVTGGCSKGLLFRCFKHSSKKTSKQKIACAPESVCVCVLFRAVNIDGTDKMEWKKGE